MDSSIPNPTANFIIILSGKKGPMPIYKKAVIEEVKI